MGPNQVSPLKPCAATTLREPIGSSGMAISHSVEVLTRLFPAYEIGSGPLSNSYASVGTLLTSGFFEGEPRMLVLINTIAVAIAKAIAGAASLWSRLQQSVADARADRARVEAELFHGRYHLSSKNDDDLPLVR